MAEFDQPSRLRVLGRQPGQGRVQRNEVVAGVGTTTFTLKEIPQTGGNVVIPLPAAAWSGLTGLAGLAIVGLVKKTRLEDYDTNRSAGVIGVDSSDVRRQLVEQLRHFFKLGRISPHDRARVMDHDF